ncbi:DUF4097 family beta strand repeat-containing protein [Nakamurella lactea]|uniref:DUF4097 family beta strand repeat-containing protein n=1 Tax=Nakamurella lactea TaxID=459515 RepID=UPI001376A49D|nr:DUF4097 family beta strand repeat-containing protein [Nakamurella lactea]
MQTFLTPDPIVVEVRNAAGLVTVDLADTQTTTVDIEQLQGTGVGFIDDLMSSFRRDAPQHQTPSNALDDVRVDLRVQESGTVLIVDTDPARNGWRSSFAVRITAPASSGVRTQTQSADIRLTGVADRLDVRTASGDVQADVVERGSLVQTASGNVRIASIGADAEIRTASGDVSVRHSGGSLSVHSTSGDVRVEEPERDVFVRAVSGDVYILDAVTGAIEATAVSGDIVVGVHPGSLAKIDLSSISGDTRNEFEVHDDPIEAPQDVPIGRLEITCRTTSGDIRLRRSAAATAG